MKTAKWSLRNAALWGIVLAPLILLSRVLLLGDVMPAGAAEWIGWIVGGMVGGAFMFAAVASIRNIFVRG